jgi:hypothetical protein
MYVYSTKPEEIKTLDENDVTKHDSNAMMILKASITLMVFARIAVTVAYKDYNWEYAECIGKYISDAYWEINMQMIWEEYEEWERQLGDEQYERSCGKDLIIV